MKSRGTRASPSAAFTLDSREKVLYCTHDLGIVARYAHDVCVMYAGRVVERAPVVGVLLGVAPSGPGTA